MRRVYLVLLCSIVVLPCLLRAEEGMWPPVLLKQRIEEMHKLGLKLSSDELFNSGGNSLKDAIVQFGGGCTGVLVSESGLLLTNHHCGFGSIQKLSSLEHDYLTKGFWAERLEDELPNPGLTVTFLISMEDVTAKILDGIKAGMNEKERTTVIKKNTDKVEKEAAKSSGYEAKVKPFYYGNIYFLFLNEVFRDVRLVGAPPSDIGSFGGDTDNWAWPRHTGDFSMFRIYSSKDNKPAEYSKDNVPYKPRKYLPVSLRGIEKGDFTMVFGYPGTTKEYLTSYGVSLIAFQENPVKVSFRQQRLDIIEAAMASAAGTRIQYASKRAGIANGWKKMMGETKGIKRLNTVEEKKKFEERFYTWASADTGRAEKYARLFSKADSVYKRFYPYDLAGIYITEGFLGVELLRYASSYKDIVKLASQKDVKAEDLQKNAGKLRVAARAFYRDYDTRVDSKVAEVLLDMISKEMDNAFKSDYFKGVEKKQKGEWAEYIKRLFSGSVFADSTKIMAVLSNPTVKAVKKLSADPAFLLAVSASDVMDKKVSPVITESNRTIDSIQRLYLEGLMLFTPGKEFYPDANSTFRIAYGKVDDYSPADAVDYSYYTTVKGILQKEDAGMYDYVVEPKLKDLINKGDFGQYADRDGSMHVAFTASNHTTGGNSGSPVLDGQGRLIGLNFDRNWEGTMSDLQYDPQQCRNIVLDIRYCLFIIDRFAGASRLISEMKIVKD